MTPLTLNCWKNSSLFTTARPKERFTLNSNSIGVAFSSASHAWSERPHTPTNQTPGGVGGRGGRGRGRGRKHLNFVTSRSCKRPARSRPCSEEQPSERYLYIVYRHTLDGPVSLAASDRREKQFHPLPSPQKKTADTKPNVTVQANLSNKSLLINKR